MASKAAAAALSSSSSSSHKKHVDIDALLAVRKDRTDKPADTEPHERPWWLRGDEARAARRAAADAAVAAFHASADGDGGFGGSSASAASSVSGGGRRMDRKRKGAGRPASPPERLEEGGEGAAAKPRSPNSQLRHLAASAKMPLKLTLNNEFDRDYWMPYNSQVEAKHHRLAEPLRERSKYYATKDKVWAKRVTDMRSAGWAVENMWALRNLQRSASEPAASSAGGEAPKPLKQPWTSSKQFQSCCVGGVGGGKQGRNIGLYEDDFLFWRNEYKPPGHGLSSTDVTQLAEQMVMQKELARK
eukprot:TRINITY_DN4113_c1_g1_i1.p1 TRINITY_DN4113_c1_g1~~TRINITY_DN4113_c1_g1_i1.p1  ORF type:complete len:327 (-),score=67.86 TRINITY_DN4113_c1_g1_i1:82-987(-)